MKNLKLISEPVMQVDSVVCNMCGEQIKKNEFGYMDDYAGMEKKWGYGSPYDGETHSIDLCQHCYEKLLRTLKIPPSNN